MKLGILASHPIQYQAPLYRALSKVLDLHVYFVHRQTPQQQGEAGFGIPFDWDVSLLDGYHHTFLRNIATNPSVSRFNGCNTPGVADEIESHAFDAFMVPGWHLRSYWQAISACKRRRVRLFGRGDSTLLAKRSILKQAAKRVLYPWMLGRFDGFFVVGQRFMDYLSYFGVPKSIMHFVPHHVDNDWFASRAQECMPTMSQFRASLGVMPGQYMVVFVGKLIPRKRPSDLVRAIRRLHRTGFPVRGVIVGSGPLEHELRSMSADLNAAIRFVGFQNQTQLPCLYAAADVLVLPSEASETWGLVVNESMACGTPAIVSSVVGCAPDLIDQRLTGRTYPCGDHIALAQAIQHVCEAGKTPEVQKALAERMERYSVETAASGIITAIAKSISCGRQQAN